MFLKNGVKNFPFYPFSKQFEATGIRKTAVAMLVVYCLLFFAGLVGNICLLVFAHSNRRLAKLTRSSSYVILANLAIVDLLFVITCLPTLAYQSMMDLTSSEWLLGDFTCQIYPFFKDLILGLTSVSLIALAIDRYKNACHVTDHVIKVSSLAIEVCKVAAIWVVAALTATPALLSTSTSDAHTTVVLSRDQAAFFEDVFAGLDIQNYSASDNSIEGREKAAKIDSNLMASYKLEFTDRQFDKREALHRVLNDTLQLIVTYKVCEETNGAVSFPSFIQSFQTLYIAYRHWWVFSFYFCFPILFSLLFILLTSRRLAEASLKYDDFRSVTHPCFANGRHDQDQTAASERPVLKNAGSVSSYCSQYPITPQYPQSRPIQEDFIIERQTSHMSIQQANPFKTLSADALSDVNLTVAHSETRPTVYQHQFSDPLPKSPSLTCASRVSVLSLALSNATGIAGSVTEVVSLPPHGHRKSKNIRLAVKRTIENVFQEKKVNIIFLSLLLFFAFFQLPQHILTILTKTDALPNSHITDLNLSFTLARYFSTFTYILNPLMLCFFSEEYRHFLAYRCCTACCA